ncbi:MAG: TauD/TfdA family dioxygenase [Pseudomonadota bacterium]
MTKLPITPDFDHWPVDHAIVNATVEDTAVRVSWADGKSCAYHAALLRENCPDQKTLHPLSREAVISPLDFPECPLILSAGTDDSGALTVEWAPGGHRSRYHPGWLRAHGWFGEETAPGSLMLWKGAEQAEPPTFDGPSALRDPGIMLTWLEALRDYGVARLEALPQRDGLLEELVSEIGPIRESNFGRTYTLALKDEPDSNAFTSDALLQHIDMPTRECPHGLQFLYCRENSTAGGEGIYCDGYRIAADMETEEPEHHLSLTTDIWEYNNRSRTSSYRAAGPVVERDGAGQVTGIRYNTWLRAPLKAPVEIQKRAYAAYRAFAARAQDPEYQMIIAYRPGDLLAFDNRRALHGRRGYDAKGGSRFIEGVYADRDDLHSRIRSLKRKLSFRKIGEAL